MLFSAHFEADCDNWRVNADLMKTPMFFVSLKPSVLQGMTSSVLCWRMWGKATTKVKVRHLNIAGSAESLSRLLRKDEVNNDATGLGRGGQRVHLFKGVCSWRWLRFSWSWHCCKHIFLELHEVSMTTHCSGNALKILSNIDWRIKKHSSYQDWARVWRFKRVRRCSRSYLKWRKRGTWKSNRPPLNQIEAATVWQVEFGFRWRKHSLWVVVPIYRLCTHILRPTHVWVVMRISHFCTCKPSSHICCNKTLILWHWLHILTPQMFHTSLLSHLCLLTLPLPRHLQASLEGLYPKTRRV